VKVKGKKISFEIEAFDSTGNQIGKANHTRFIVASEPFMEKATARPETSI
jgi:predicted thioesterase